MIKENTIKLKELTRTPLTNVVQIDRSAPLTKKVGKIFINVTFIGKQKERFTVEGGSRELRLLGTNSQRKIAFDQAFAGALSLIQFSYETFIINWVHFSYFIPKKKPQPVFHFENTIKAV